MTYKYVSFDYGSIRIPIYARTKRDLLAKVLTYTKHQKDLTYADVQDFMNKDSIPVFVEHFNRIKNIPNSKYPIVVWTPDPYDDDDENLYVKAVAEERESNPVTVCIFEDFEIE